MDDGRQLTGEDLAEFQRRWEQATTPAARARHMNREMRRLLSRRTRFRLWRHSRIDGLAAWLADHGHERACVALWRVTGLWSG